MNWKEACKEVGYDPYECNPPEAIYKYFAYKNGVVTECKSLKEAKELSDKYDKVQINKEEVDKYWLIRGELEAKSLTIFLNALRKKYEDVHDGVYNLLYEKAYDEKHAWGYDEVAIELEDLYHFIKEVKKAYDEV